jgi:hypothetical protein
MGLRRGEAIPKGGGVGEGRGSMSQVSMGIYLFRESVDMVPYQNGEACETHALKLRGEYNLKSGSDLHLILTFVRKLLCKLVLQ